MSSRDNFQKITRRLINLLLTVIIAILILVIVLFYSTIDVKNEEVSSAPINNEMNDLIIDDGYETVKANCLACHSSKLVTQNRATREGWKSIIRWMQQTQNLWDLGDNEAIILDYLSKNYAPENKGRRQQLSGIEWYELGD